MKIAVLHIAKNAIDPLEKIIHEIDPEIEITTYLNESIIKSINKNEMASKQDKRDFMQLFMEASKKPYDGILIGCSIFSAQQNDFKPFTSKPVVGIDQPMIHLLSKKTEGKIGVLGTNEFAVKLTKQQILSQGKDEINQFAVDTLCISEANQLTGKDDKTAYIQKLKDGAQFLFENGADIICLAQISMTIAESAIQQMNIPVISSGKLGIQKLKSEIMATE